MSIHHDGVNGSINLSNGSLTTRVHDSNGKGFFIEDPNGGSSQTIAKFEKDSTNGKGRCELMHGGTKKLETTDAGVTVTGDLTVTGGGGFQTGMIMLWYGSSNNIPSGWVLCNGGNNTPDLRSKFIKSSSDSI